MYARLLGPLELDHGRMSIPVQAPRRRALMARLLLDANRTVSLDRLVDDLWGADTPPSAAKMVQIHVSHLRKLLPAGVLVTRSPGYAVEIRADALDVHRFQRLLEQGRAALEGGAAAEAAERLADALALWRGPALAEFDEPFAVLEAARLEELRLACVEERVEADLTLGRHANVIGELDALVDGHPLRERLRRQLMLALYRSGRHAEALAAYRQLRRLLSSQLGIEPSAALRDLERRMLQQDPALDVGTAAARRHPRTATDCLGTPSGRRSRRGACASVRRR